MRSEPKSRYIFALELEYRVRIEGRIQEFKRKKFLGGGSGNEVLGEIVFFPASSRIFPPSLPASFLPFIYSSDIYWAATVSSTVSIVLSTNTISLF